MSVRITQCKTRCLRQNHSLRISLTRTAEIETVGAERNEYVLLDILRIY